MYVCRIGTYITILHVYGVPIRQMSWARKHAIVRHDGTYVTEGLARRCFWVLRIWEGWNSDCFRPTWLAYSSGRVMAPHYP